MKRLQNADALHYHAQSVFAFPHQSHWNNFGKSLRHYRGDYKVCCFDESLNWTLIVVVPENESAVTYCSMII